MAKLVHLKKQNGKSFHVTPHAFETTIKTDKNWRKKYDYVGEVDEEEVGAQSESAQKATPEVKTEEKVKVAVNEKEEKTEEIFNSQSNNSENGNNKQQSGNEEEQVQEQQSGKNGKFGKGSRKK